MRAPVERRSISVIRAALVSTSTFCPVVFGGGLQSGRHKKSPRAAGAGCVTPDYSATRERAPTDGIRRSNSSR